MQIRYALCFVLAAINAVSNVEAGEKNRHLFIGQGGNRIIAKREVSLLIDNFPSESNLNNVKNQKVIYSRISKQRYRGPKSKHNPPAKYGPPAPKYGPPTPKYSASHMKRRPSTPPKAKWNSRKIKRNHLKKVKGPVGVGVGVRYNSDSRPPKAKYGNKTYKQRHVSYKNNNIPHKKITHFTAYQSSEPTGFGEPPAEAHLPTTLNNPIPTGNEMPLDSYGNPVQNALNDYSNDFGYDQSGGNNYQPFNKEYPPNGQQQHQVPDNGFAFSHNHQTVVTPDSLFVDAGDNAGGKLVDVYSELAKHIEEEEIILKNKKNNKHLSNKPVNKPWTKENEIIVGGQYAEPPARYIPKFQPSAPMIAGSDDFSPYGIADEFGTSATVSPYVNYKNTNMAFSPQNLNDAFSIVDK